MSGLIGVIPNIGQHAANLANGSLLRQSVDPAGPVRTWTSINAAGKVQWPAAPGQAAAHHGVWQQIACVTLWPTDKDKTPAPIDVNAVLAGVPTGAIVELGNELDHVRNYFKIGHIAAAKWLAPLAVEAKKRGYKVCAGGPVSTQDRGQIRDYWASVLPIFGDVDFIAAHAYGRTAAEVLTVVGYHLEVARERGLKLLVTEFNLTELDPAKYAAEMTTLLRGLRGVAELSTMYCGDKRKSDGAPFPYLWQTADDKAARVATQYFPHWTKALAESRTTTPTPPVPSTPVVKTCAELVSAIAFGAKTVAVNETIFVPNGVTLNLGTATIVCTRPHETGRAFSVFDLGNDSTVELGVLDVDNAVGLHSFQRWFNISGRRNVVIRGVAMRRGGEFVQIVDSFNVTIMDNQIGADDASLRRYGVIVSGGSDIKITGNLIRNSTDEHCIRLIKKYGRVQVIGNKLYQRSGQLPHDIVKGCITAQQGADVAIIGNECDGGPIGFGPLMEGDATASEYSYDAVIVGNVANINVANGASSVVMSGNRGVLTLAAGNDPHNRPVANIDVIDHNGTIQVNRPITNLRVRGRLVTGSGLVAAA
jgi:hypothetical protein